MANGGSVVLAPVVFCVVLANGSSGSLISAVFCAFCMCVGVTFGSSDALAPACGGGGGDGACERDFENGVSDGGRFLLDEA